jgi:hypothetical protein
MGTRAFAMKKALIAATLANPAFSELAELDSVWDSAYSGVVRPNKVIWFGEIVWTYDQNVVFGGIRPGREEEFNIRVGIEINDHDDDQTDADDKAEELMVALEEMVSSDYRQYGVDGIVSMGVVPIGLGEGPGGAEGGRAAFMALQINVKARK